MSPPRTRVPELMDQPEANQEQLRRSLGDLERVNLWLGGRRTAVRLVLELAARVPHRPVRLLDVATGACDIPRAVARAGRLRALPIRVFATDIHPVTAVFASEATRGDPWITVSVADALDLPFRDADFDLAMFHTALHHFDPPQATQVLSELYRVSRYGIVVTDLTRSWPSLIGVRLLASTVWRTHRITRHDGPASVRAAYTPEELAQLAHFHSRDQVRVSRHGPFRQSLVIVKNTAFSAPAPTA